MRRFTFRLLRTNGHVHIYCMEEKTIPLSSRSNGFRKVIERQEGAKFKNPLLVPSHNLDRSIYSLVRRLLHGNVVVKVVVLTTSTVTVF